MIPLFFYIIIFQLTRSRGAWRNKEWVCCAGNYFNSHAHVERDLTETVEEPTKGISTHTLTWSVTYGVCLSATHLAFQLTRSRGAWQNRHTEQHSCGAFQLTRSRGAWLYFIIVTIGSIIFQLTRSRGAWHPYYTTSPWKSNFNSHAHVERDHCSLKTACIPFDFNSHAHVERDLGA